MARWEGWSASWPQVHLTRALAVLLAGVSGRRTSTTVTQVICQLHLAAALSPAAVAAALTDGAAPFAPIDPRGPAEAQHLKLTADGARLAAEFRAGHESLARLRVAQKTVLRCCSAHPEAEFLQPASMLDEPLSWLYGQQLHLAELRRAAATLSTSGLLFMVGDQDNSVVQLTARGLLCVQRFHSDPHQMHSQ